jgi:hypothetical protein
MNELDILKKEVEELKAKWKSMESASSFPFSVDQAIKARVGGSVQSTGTGAATTQTIALSGNAQNIDVPAQPTGTLKVRVGITDYELLYK